MRPARRYERQPWGAGPGLRQRREMRWSERQYELQERAALKKLQQDQPKKVDPAGVVLFCAIIAITAVALFIAGVTALVHAL